MTTLWHLALKELRDGLRNRWVAATILALLGLALVLALLGSAPGGSVKASALAVTLVSLSSLSVYLIPLIALMLSYDAVVGEAERGSLLLLLSYPVARWQVLLGKLLGHTAILAIAILVGYGGTAVLVGLAGGAEAEAWSALAALCASSLLLGAVFLALGYLLSVLADERGKAAGMAIGLWLLLVVVYDLALLGLLISDQRQTLSQGLFSVLLTVNPTDAFRVFNLTFTEGAARLGGLAGVAAGSAPGHGLTLGVMLAWTAGALGAAAAVLHRKEI